MAGPTTAQRGGSKSRNARSGKSARSGPSRPPGKRPARRPRPTRRRFVLWAVLTVLVGGAAGWALYGSSWLRATRVEVSGLAVLTPEEVRAAAAVPLGEPLVSVDTDAIAERLRKALPRIDTVDVERSWPHAIALKVVERQPRAIIEKGGKFIEIDGSGVRFATVDHAPPNVPRLSLEAATSPSLRRFGPARLEREGVRVAEALPAAVRAATRVIHVRSYDAITLDLTGGRTVVWGSGERGEAKARTLLALLKAAKGANHFDVSAPSAPAASGS
ncbi:FtsQ-type POTRA domain-containing protein [Streptomyces sp. UNOC14_S4]|uniref:cell division protein FtsQ/DivIB n=1 Tax=Streptomyces sp. UNOC14_S4 TaxID=2872340 RepID=UPI001E5650D2|nr:FtsQ-type POTRA domain-containing protein [Streptomyces sp. UNOC14_S4]MCC3768158.1 FtsQ-type POTRA domain-containing protein [Streptomyces sp. UNOC14_S4]